MDFIPKPSIPLETLFTAASSDTLDLLRKFFIFNPENRVSTYTALSHPYFSNEPSPTPPEDLPFYAKPNEEI